MNKVFDTVNEYLSRYDIDEIILSLEKNNSFFDNLISHSYYPNIVEDRFTIPDVISAIELNQKLTGEQKNYIIEKFSTKVRDFEKKQFGI